MARASTGTIHRSIVFSHANSFPARTYETLFEGWRAAGFSVHAVDKFGHDPRYPVTMDWPHLVRQLTDFIEHEVRHPAYLVGHSLGGFLSMMAACRKPHLAQGVIALDSPVLHGWKRAGVALSKRLGTFHYVMTPGRVAAQRTQEWPSLHAAHAHFTAKPKFAALHPRILHDYLQHGTEPPAPGASARRLSFHREVEAAIYMSMPHDLVREFRRHPPPCPFAFVGGRRSRETRRVGIEGIRQIAGPRLSWIDGTHLYPFEQPQATVAEVLRWIDAFERESACPLRPAQEVPA